MNKVQMQRRLTAGKKEIGQYLAPYCFLDQSYREIIVRKSQGSIHSPCWCCSWGTNLAAMKVCTRSKKGIMKSVFLFFFFRITVSRYSGTPLIQPALGHKKLGSY